MATKYSNVNQQLNSEMYHYFNKIIDHTYV